jgi:small GTP-binding protein
VIHGVTSKVDPLTAVLKAKSLSMPSYKVILLGASAVGKTSIINSYVSGDFSDQTKPTIGLGYVTKSVEVRGDSIPLEIWDTAGQERFRSLSQLHFRDTSVVLLVYNVVDQASLKDLDNYVNALNEKTDVLPALFVVGNMIDRTEEREIDFDEGAAFARKVNAEYYETSAKAGDGIRELFFKVAEGCRDRGPVQREAAKKVQLDEIGGSEPTKSKSGCC